MMGLATCLERQMELQLEYPLTLYTHCTSHCLNLAVVASFEEVSVRNMIGVVNRVSVFFFAHPKRQNKLEEAIQNTQPESKVVKQKISVEHDGLNASMPLIVSRTFTPP